MCLDCFLFRFTSYIQVVFYVLKHQTYYFKAAVNTKISLCQGCPTEFRF